MNNSNAQAATNDKAKEAVANPTTPNANPNAPKQDSAKPAETEKKA